MANDTASPDPMLRNISVGVVELTDEDVNESMAGMGVRPEDLRDPAERLSYEEYLSKQNTKR